MKLQMSPKLVRYTLKFAFRVLVFASVLVLYFRDRQWITDFLTRPYRYGVTVLHVLWALFMWIMLMHLLPGRFRQRTMAWLKMKPEHYAPMQDYDELALLRYVQHQNRKAWQVMLVWLCFNAVWGALYLTGVIREAELLLLTAFYFLSDYICILLYCPFQSRIMGNKCCVNCRIYDWGHFMMFTPMLFIRSFFTWSLFFTSVVVLIHWEITYTGHPERFWEGSNRNLKCENCRDQTCQYKRAIAAGTSRRGG